jgi:hypothetical protein
MKNSGFDGLFEVPVEAGREPFEEPDLRRRANFQSRAPRAGADFKAMAIARLKEAGATIEKVNFRIEGFLVDAQVSGSNGRPFLVLARGTPDEQDRSALRRTDTVEKAGFMAMQLARRQALPIILITSDLPKRSTRAGHYLAALSDDLWDVVSYRSDLKGFQRLRAHFTAPIEKVPPAAPWRAPEKISSPTLLNEFSDVDARAHSGPRRPNMDVGSE